MKGLILKDLLNLARYARIYPIVIVFYAIISLSMDDGDAYIVFAIVFMFIMLILTSFSADEMAKWNLYALSLPISRKELVQSKYILALLLLLLSTAIAVVVQIGINWIRNYPLPSSFFWDILFITSSGLCFIAFLLPMIYRWGAEKSRYAMMLLCIAPVVVVMLFEKMNVIIDLPSFLSATLMLRLFPFFGLFLYGISMVLSTTILATKDIT